MILEAAYRTKGYIIEPKRNLGLEEIRIHDHCDAGTILHLAIGKVGPGHVASL